MKKLITLLVLVLGMFVLSGCMTTDGSSDDSKGDTSRGNSSNNDSREDSKDKDSSKESKEQLLYEDDDVKVTFIEIFEVPELKGTCYLRLKVKNKSDKNVTVYLKDSYVNDTAQMIGSGTPMELAPGKSSQTPFFFGYTNLGITSKNEIEKIEFKVRLMDDDFDTVVETESLVVEFD